MPNSNGFGRRYGGTVTVIEEPVRRNTMRNAKITGCVTWVIVTLLAATVLASKWHPVLALLAAALIGAGAAFVTAIAVLIWPVVRVIWWWLPEIALAAGLVACWIWLADHVKFPWLPVLVMSIVAVPALIPQVRRLITAVAWCLVVRHRIRTCFNEFIITNRTGSLPLIFPAIPTPVGERLWLHLRPGLSLDAIQARLGQIAVGCWAASATATAPSATNAAVIRIDIKRRDALTGKVISPLLGHITPGAPAKTPDITIVPGALDLADVPAADVQTPLTRPARADRRPAPDSTPVGAVNGADDVSDYI